jgi:hypothetical protein
MNRELQQRIESASELLTTDGVIEARQVRSALYAQAEWSETGYASIADMLHREYGYDAYQVTTLCHWVLKHDVPAGRCHHCATVYPPGADRCVRCRLTPKGIEPVTAG